MKKEEIKSGMVLIDTISGKIGVPCTHPDYVKSGESYIWMVFKEHDLIYGLASRPESVPLDRLKEYDGHPIFKNESPNVMINEKHVRSICSAGTKGVCGYLSTITLSLKGGEGSIAFKCLKVDSELGGIWRDNKSRGSHPFGNHCGGRFGEWKIDKKSPEQKELWEKTLEELRG